MLEACFMTCIPDKGFVVALIMYSYLGYHNSTVANTSGTNVIVTS